MPLVATGAVSSNPKTEEWSNKLVGKKLHDTESNETVRQSFPTSPPAPFASCELTRWQTFCKKDLPEPSRIVTPGAMLTRDFREDRLNVHLDDDGVVTHVAHN